MVKQFSHVRRSHVSQGLGYSGTAKTLSGALTSDDSLGRQWSSAPTKAQGHATHSKEIRLDLCGKHARLQNRLRAITVFVVPSECFEPFLFQPETTTVDVDTESKQQPKYQLVLEMPDAFVMKDNLKKYLALPEVSNRNKRRHSCATTRVSEQPVYR
jgi:hypothetical protein